MENQQDSSFHDRAAIVAKDILLQIGLDDEKIRKASTFISTISMLPPIGPLAQAQNMVKEIEPFLLMAQDNLDPGFYIKSIPQEKMEYLINQIIARLEWVKYGNSEQEKSTEE